MPRKYIRNNNVARGEWTQENLVTAIELVKRGEISKNEAQRRFGIPIRTLTRRLITGNTTKSGLGPQATLGIENEQRLACYLKLMSSAGIPPDRNTIRSLAYQFAESQGIKHKFSKEKEMAGQHWLMSFLERNKDIAVNEGGGPLFARAQRMSREGMIDSQLELGIPSLDATTSQVIQHTSTAEIPSEFSDVQPSSSREDHFSPFSNATIKTEAPIVTQNIDSQYENSITEMKLFALQPAGCAENRNDNFVGEDTSHSAKASKDHVTKENQINSSNLGNTPQIEQSTSKEKETSPIEDVQVQNSVQSYVLAFAEGLEALPTVVAIDFASNVLKDLDKKVREIKLKQIKKEDNDNDSPNYTDSISEIYIKEEPYDSDAEMDETIKQRIEQPVVKKEKEN